MKSLKVEIYGASTAKYTVAVGKSSTEDKILPLKMQNGKLTASYTTDQSKATIKIYSTLDVGGFFWYITQIFFYLISVFGIFDIARRRKPLYCAFVAEVNLNDGENTFKIFARKQKDGQAAFELERLSNVSVLKNSVLTDESAKKIYTALTVTKVLIVIAAIALMIFGIYKYINP